jgi:pimeloyl-ACP methyl ester carboxylesterase
MHDAEAVTISNKHDLKLFGTFHRPALAGKDLPAVVMLSPGVKMRVGPGRLYLPLTDALNRLGFAVLRFDFYGLGDSEGDLQEPMLADVYNHIEVGRHVDDTLCALDWLSTQRGYDRFILGGLCGGAITALLTAERDTRVEALLSLGMTVTLASNAATPAEYLTRGELGSLRRGYYRRLLQPKSWGRFLTLQSDYSIIWRSLVTLLPRPDTESSLQAPSTAQPPAVQEQRGNANPLFPTAYLSFLQRGGRALMLFSGSDRLRHEYQEKFVTPYASRLGALASQIHDHVVEEANHVLSFHEWQREMVNVSQQWLASIYAGAADRLPGAQIR